MNVKYVLPLFKILNFWVGGNYSCTIPLGAFIGLLKGPYINYVTPILTIFDTLPNNYALTIDLSLNPHAPA